MWRAIITQVLKRRGRKMMMMKKNKKYSTFLLSFQVSPTSLQSVSRIFQRFQWWWVQITPFSYLRFSDNVYIIFTDFHFLLLWDILNACHGLNIHSPNICFYHWIRPCYLSVKMPVRHWLHWQNISIVGKANFLALSACIRRGPFQKFQKCADTSGSAIP